MNLKLAFRNLCLTLVSTMACGLTESAQADPSIPHKEKAEGRLTNVVNPDPETGLGGRMDFVGIGKGTHLGNYSQVGGHDFDAFGNLSGEFESTAADGATISGIYFGTFTDIGGGLFRFDVTAVWLEGTGRLDGIMGAGEVVAILDLATGEFTYVTDAEWTRP